MDPLSMDPTLPVLYGKERPRHIDRDLRRKLNPIPGSLFGRHKNLGSFGELKDHLGRERGSGAEIHPVGGYQPDKRKI